MVRLFIFIVTLMFSFSSHASECGIFKVVKGKVEFQKKGKKKFRKARVNKRVCSGDTIKSAKKSRAKIEMAGGNEINISPDTQLLIEKYKHNVAKNEKKVLLNVLYGKIRSNVKQKYGNDEKSHYRVKTKSAVAGVRGTEFLTEFNRNTQQSRVVTFEGSVDVGNFEGGQFVPKVNVKPGQFTSNTNGTDPHPARDVPPKEFAQMDRETNVGGDSGTDRGVSNDPGAKPDDNKDKDPGNESGKEPQPEGKDPKAGGPEPDGDIAGEPGSGPDDVGENNREPASRPIDDLPEPDVDTRMDPGACGADCVVDVFEPPPPPPPLPDVPPPVVVDNIIQNQKANVTIIPVLPGQ